MDTFGKPRPYKDGFEVIETLGVSLPEALAKQVNQRVLSGQYRNSDEVVNAALRLLFDREDHSDFLKGEIKVGSDQFETGQFRVLSMDLLKEIKEDGRARQAAMRKEAS
jgi:putative addiction module CopG family antidote